MPERRIMRDLEAEDSDARERALDVTCSFLVQAPAGSGKTELLIQRFLALLAHVERPERIVAMTFTRKAAGEMRERIVRALTDAEEGTPVVSLHEQRTRTLAQDVLRQDERHGWQLVQHPARLAVFTIDALCARLAQQAPLATRLGAAPRYQERADALYIEAARAALAAALPDDELWRRLLRHLDNDASRVVGLLAAMLARRDQWLIDLPRRSDDAFRAHVEAALVHEIRDVLAAARAAFVPSHVDSLAALERHAIANLRSDPEAAVLLAGLTACADAGGLPPANVEAMGAWTTLADWLLVAGKPRFRLALNKKRGFPPKGTRRDAAAAQAQKDAMRSLLAELASVDRLADALDAVRWLPPPRYAEETWSFVDALLEVLPSVVAELLVVFRDSATVDFTQGALAALEALGSDDAPTDLLLRIDGTIEHLLVDEFQDTSFVQLALIRRLTGGWQPGDGRTLFAVGDPMQSIYRFRGAEVRLFVEAQQRDRIADVPVATLVLRRNFRSVALLVDWVNATFPAVLGRRNDPWHGHVAFAAAAPGDALAVHSAMPRVGMSVEAFEDAGQEARSVAARVRDALAEGAEDVAILVRARTHLTGILPALRASRITFAALDLDALAERQSVLDLQALAHALLQPADRLAWLAVLRAPWCGLTLADLFAFAAAADARCGGSFASLFAHGEPVEGLSADGSARIAWVANALGDALRSRGRLGATARVRGAWLALGGPAMVDEAIDLDAAERFFALLAAHETAGDVPDWAAFVAALAQLHAAPAPGSEPAVKVMTLHRAKGLQFDTVILPGLARPTRNDEAALLRWRRRPKGILVAPITARGGDEDPVHAYLRALAADEERAELGRLLYVGATRAKRRLHLTAVLGAQRDAQGVRHWKLPPAGSALAVLWPGIAHLLVPPTATVASHGKEVRAAPLLARRPTSWEVPMASGGVAMSAQPVAIEESVPFDWAHETARHVGTVAHRLFAQIARDGIDAWDQARVARFRNRVRAELAGEGVDAGELEAATTQVLAAVERTLADARGRWLFAPSHADARSEWALAGVDRGDIVHVIVDRTFVAEGTRWIVDFKTGTHEGADVEAFLDREVERYRPSLERYARLVGALDPRPLMLGLYYPLLGGWRSWQAPQAHPPHIQIR